MDKKALKENTIRIIIFLIVYPILTSAALFVLTSFDTPVPDSNIFMWIKYIIFAIIIIAPPFIFGRFFLKDSGNSLSNLRSILVPTIPIFIIIVILMNLFISIDGIGFFILLMNPLGTILTAFLGQFLTNYSSSDLMGNILFSLCIGLSPLITMLISFLGLFWRRRHEEN